MFGWFKRYVGSFENKALFITGCDTGFGRLMALKFCEEGARVYAACLTENAAETLSKEARGKGSITTVILNVTNEEHVQKAFDFVKADLEKNDLKLHALINNAGINGGWYAEMTEMSVYKRLMEVNYFGPVRITKTFIPLLQQPGGRIIGVVSALGIYAMKGISAYNGSKFAHSAFLDTIRNELRGSGIKVVKVMPGGHRTEGIKTYDDDVAARSRFEEASDDVKSRYPPQLAEDFLAKGKKYAKNFGDPINVVNIVRDGLLLKNPRVAYYVGNDAWFLAKCLAVLPTPWSDCVQNSI